MTALMEAEIDARLPDRYEIVDGEVVELPPMGIYSSEVANRLQNELVVYGRTSGFGRAKMDMLFRMPSRRDPNRNRRPDISFVSYDRWPANQALPYRGNPMNVVPDLIVEVASPTDEAEDLLAKGHEYLAAGARLVWLVYPRLRLIHALESPQSVRVFLEADELDGGSVLPGFRVAVAGLFPPRSDEADEGDAAEER